MPQDICGLSDGNRLETYGNAELFLALMGTGVTRSLYMLTAHDRETHALLFDLRIEASASELAARARQAGTSADDQAATIAFDCAHRIVDAGVYRRTTHFRLQVGQGADVLGPALS